MPDKADKFFFFAVLMKRGHSIFQFDQLVVSFKENDGK